MTTATRCLLSLGLAAFALGCSDTVEENQEFPNFSVIFRNSATDGQFIHIFGPDETNDISNRLQPGATRPYLVDNQDTGGSGGSIVITGGRNFGQSNELRVTVTCTYSNTSPPSAAEVRWNGTALSCVSWQ